MAIEYIFDGSGTRAFLSASGSTQQFEISVDAGGNIQTTFGGTGSSVSYVSTTGSTMTGQLNVTTVSGTSGIFSTTTALTSSFSPIVGGQIHTGTTAAFTNITGSTLITGSAINTQTLTNTTSMTSPLATITTINATNITGTNISGTSLVVSTANSFTSVFSPIIGGSLHTGTTASFTNITGSTSITGTIINAQVINAPSYSGNSIVQALGNDGLFNNTITSGFFSQGPANVNAAPTGLQIGTMILGEGYISIYGSTGTSATNSDANIDIENRGTGTFNYSEYTVARSRGIFPGVSGVIAGDDLGHFGFWGAADISGDYVNGAYIRGVAAENFTTGTAGTRMQHYISESGTINLVNKLDIGPSGTGFIGTIASPFSTASILTINATNITGTNISGTTATFGSAIDFVSTTTPKIIMNEVTLGSIGTPAASTLSLFADSNDEWIRSKENDGTIRSLTNYFYNVKDYGAVGDGVHDDTAAIYSACNQITNANAEFRGGTVFFPAGIYLVTSTIAISGNSTRLMGDTRGASTVLNTGTFVNGDIFKLTPGTEFCEFRGLEIFSSAARTAGAGINTNGANDVIIDDMNFNNQFTAVAITGSSIKVSFSNSTINNTTTVSGVSILINNGAAGDTYIGPNVISSNSGMPRASIQLTQTGHTSINRCNFTHSATGLWINPALTNLVNYLFIDHTLFDSSLNVGMLMDASPSGAQIRSVKIVNSWFAGSTNAEGVKFSGISGTISDVTFDACRFLNNGTNGITVNYGSGIKFQGCTVAGNSQLGAGVNDGIFITSGIGSISIVNNNIGTFGTATNTQRYGINMSGINNGGIIVVDNDLTTNLSGSMIDLFNVSGFNQKVVTNNLGHTLNGQLASIVAPVTVTANANTVIVGGLNACPIPINSLRAGDSFRVVIDGSFTGTATATAIQIHLGTAGTAADPVILTASITGVVGTSQGNIICDFTIRTIGAAGTVAGAMTFNQSGATGLGNAAVIPAVFTTTTAPNTTVNNYMTVSILSAVAGSSGTVQFAVIEKI